MYSNFSAVSVVLHFDPGSKASFESQTQFFSRFALNPCCARCFIGRLAVTGLVFFNEVLLSCERLGFD